MLKFFQKKTASPSDPISKLPQQPKESTEQNLDIYWDPEMAAVLETWGIGNVWSEIQYLLVNAKGKALDIACGTGKTMDILSGYPNLQLYGCDISPFLLEKAQERGISIDALRECDATKTDYVDNEFDYSYSIGSLEHFTEEGIPQFIAEAHRITKCSSMHQIPVSRSGINHGWIHTRYQSYYNNSVDWWLERFRAVYTEVYILDSRWEDELSVGKWFICLKTR